MLNLSTVPTDKLYKFYVFIGFVLIVLGIYLKIYQSSLTSSERQNVVAAFALEQLKIYEKEKDFALSEFDNPKLTYTYDRDSVFSRGGTVATATDYLIGYDTSMICYCDSTLDLPNTMYERFLYLDTTKELRLKRLEQILNKVDSIQPIILKNNMENYSLRNKISSYTNFFYWGVAFVIILGLITIIVNIYRWRLDEKKTNPNS